MYIPLVFGEQVEDVVFFSGRLGLHGHLDRAGLVIAGRKPATVCMYACIYVCIYMYAYMHVCTVCTYILVCICVCVRKPIKYARA